MLGSRLKITMRYIIVIAAISIALCVSVSADLIWWDGTREPGNTPPGKLLSDNLGYYGDSVRTGVEYRYEEEPDVQADVRGDEPGVWARRLLDGQLAPGTNFVSKKGSLAVNFDFKRNCTFSEIDVSSVKGKLGVRIEALDAATGIWRVIFERSLEDSPVAALHRIKLADVPTGRTLRIWVNGGDKTRLDEVLVWGDAEVTKENPEIINPIVKTLKVQAYCSFSIPGVDKTGIVFAEHRDWKAIIGRLADQPAVWSQVATWDSLSHSAILPSAQAINKPVNLTLARNETECAALALTSTCYPEEKELEVNLSEFKNVKTGKPEPMVIGKLRVAGAIPSSIYGVVIGPLFEQDNMPGLSIMKRYVTNADSIQGFPKLKLPRMSSAIIWLSVTTTGVKPGVYEATLSYKGDKGIKIRAEVLDVTLPDTFAYVQSYSFETNQFPFNYDDRTEREVAYRQSIGLNTYYGFPEPGWLQDIARKRGKNVVFQVHGLPGKYMHTFDPMTLKPEDKKEIADNMTKLVERARSLGLDYKDWCLELWDEPDAAGCLTMAALSEIIHNADPKIRIYCNPTTSDVGGDWYNKHIAVSYPYYKTWFGNTDGDKYFNSPRWVNGYYKIVTHSSRGERASYIELYRDEAWTALARGWNGWGFFAYYRPQGDPWNDFDASGTEELPADFSLVFPGPRGPIPTRPAEAVREGYEDFCLMTLLREKDKATYASILSDYKKSVPLTELRLRALKVAAKIGKK